MTDINVTIGDDAIFVGEVVSKPLLPTTPLPSDDFLIHPFED